MSHQEQYSHVRYGQQYRRGRFYNFPMQNLHLSSRFGGTPLPMEREFEAPGSYSQRDAAPSLNPYSPLPPIGVSLEATAALLNSLYSKLPPYTARLPTQPVYLNQDEELAVMRELQTQLRYLEMGKLKQVYLELANYDEDLSGLCSFEQMNQAFVRNNIYLSNPVARVVASAFLSPHEPHWVNYEKVLSFIGASLRLGHQNSASESAGYYQTNQQQQQQHGQYYQQEQQYFSQQQQTLQPLQSLPTPPTTPPPSPRQQPGGTAMTALTPDRDLPRALRQLESEAAALASVTRPAGQPIVNFESLRLAFQRADRLLRGTLGADQMKRIVWDAGLQLSGQLMDSLISLCRHRGGGQFDWEQFVGLLEKGLAAQAATGLRIPVARQPLEYARQLPEPTPSWPQAEPFEKPPPSPGQALYRSPASNTPQQQQHQQQQQQLSSRGSMVEPWFNRFMRLADALYRRDSEARGFLTEEQVRDVVLRYSADYQLGIGQAAIQAALEASRATAGGSPGRVNINELLKRLGVRPIGIP